MSLPFDIAAAADWIEALQRPDGSIPWIESGLWDPWCQTESAMGLIAAGRIGAATHAFEHLAATQEDDGGWTHDLGAAAPLDVDNRRLLPDAPRLKETNFAAWTAVGVWALAKAAGGDALRRFGPMALRACDFALSLQTPDGDIVWTAPAPGEDVSAVDSLFAANCAIFKSLTCAIRIAAALGRDCNAYSRARTALHGALLNCPERFDRTWAPKTAHAMDWYYPVLTGVFTGRVAQMQLRTRWDEFVEPGQGCRCIGTEPWATAAETAELALACAAIGWDDEARHLLACAGKMQDETGGLWMGRQFALNEPWPLERPSWTAGAALMAADALYGLSAAGGLFAPQSRSSSISDPVRSAGANRPEALARR